MSAAEPPPALEDVPPEIFEAIADYIVAAGGLRALSRLGAAEIRDPKAAQLDFLTSGHGHGVECAAAVRRFVCPFGAESKNRLRYRLLEIVAPNLVILLLQIGSPGAHPVARAIALASNLRHLGLDCNAGCADALAEIVLPPNVTNLILEIDACDSWTGVLKFLARLHHPELGLSLRVQDESGPGWRGYRLPNAPLPKYAAEHMVSLTAPYPFVEALVKDNDLALVELHVFVDSQQGRCVFEWLESVTGMRSLRSLTIELRHAFIALLHELPPSLENLRLVDMVPSDADLLDQDEIRAILFRLPRLKHFSVLLRPSLFQTAHAEAFWGGLEEAVRARAEAKA
ncbi:hypothetical protein DFJ74DRAFT_741880 [Hyaloraphidium curvatum]|nr:hypothetical protein DFJ74DRAFT_741880 [Hyaloraphidium curvatum]